MKVLPFPFSLLEGDTLGKTIYNFAIALAVVFVIAWFGWAQFKGVYYEWKAGNAIDRAEHAEANAKTATRNAEQATGAAHNAADTRAAMDAGTAATRSNTNAAVKRITDNDPTPVADSGALPADLVRELEGAHDRARAAADRLQRTRTR